MRRSSFVQGHPFDPRPVGHRSRDSRGKFRSEKWDFSTRNLLLAAYTPPLRNKVRQPAGFPTPFRWAYPVLFCAGVKCGRIPSANWGRALPFPLPLTQSGSLRASRHPFGWAYPVLDCAGIKCGRRASANWGRALPFPLPLTRSNPSVRLDAGQLPLHRGAEGTTPQSACGLTAPLTQGSQGITPQSACGLPAPLTQGSRRSNPSVSLRADSSPYTGEPRNNPSVSLRAASSPYTGEPKEQSLSSYAKEVAVTRRGR